MRAIEAAGPGAGWSEDEPGYGRVLHFTDPDGHPFGLHHDTRRYVASDATRPSSFHTHGTPPVA